MHPIMRFSPARSTALGLALLGLASLPIAAIALASQPASQLPIANESPSLPTSSDPEVKNLAEEAVYLELRATAATGDRDAQYLLAVHLADIKTPRFNLPEAVVWFRRAAEQGDPHAQYKLARLYQTGAGIAENAQMAAHWYRKSAEQGIAPAQLNLALMSEAGMGIPVDLEAAERWYRRLAETGDREAQFFLGSLLTDPAHLDAAQQEEAMVWLRRSSDQGYPNASALLAILLSELDDPNELHFTPESLELLDKAARAGEPTALYNLSLVYWHGDGLPRHPALAYLLAAMAEEHGLEDAKGMADSIADDMSEQEWAVTVDFMLICAEHGDYSDCF